MQNGGGFLLVFGLGGASGMLRLGIPAPNYDFSNQILFGDGVESEVFELGGFFFSLKSGCVGNGQFCDIFWEWILVHPPLATRTTLTQAKSKELIIQAPTHCKSPRRPS